MRLQGIRVWSCALADVLGEQFATNPATYARALRSLFEITTQATVAISRGWRDAQNEQSDNEAERARRGMTRMQALQRLNSGANAARRLAQTLGTTALAGAEEMGADLCPIYRCDEVTRELALRA